MTTDGAAQTAFERVRARVWARISRNPVLFVSLLTCVGYFAIARTVVNFYPFSVFPMYDSLTLPAGARVVVRDAAGALHETGEYGTWDCGPLIDSEEERPNNRDFYYEPHVDVRVATAIERDSGHDPAQAPIDLVRHVWRFESGGPPRTEDHVLRHCKAVRRGTPSVISQLRSLLPR